MNPFAAEAIMKPARPVVRSVSRISSAWPPAHPGVEHVDHDPVALVHQERLRVRRERRQIGLLRAGRPRGHAVALDEREVHGLDAVVVAGAALASHSTLSMVSAEHQWVLSQLIESSNGANPGG